MVGGNYLNIIVKCDTSRNELEEIHFNMNYTYIYLTLNQI